jgi:hypothetical protein
VDALRRSDTTILDIAAGAGEDDRLDAANVAKIARNKSRISASFQTLRDTFVQADSDCCHVIRY